MQFTPDSQNSRESSAEVLGKFVGFLLRNPLGQAQKREIGLMVHRAFERDESRELAKETNALL